MRSTSNTSRTTASLVAFSLERFAASARADFRFAPLNALLLVIFFVIGLFVHLNLYPFNVHAVALCLGSALFLTVALRIFRFGRRWWYSSPRTPWRST